MSKEEIKTLITNQHKLQTNDKNELPKQIKYAVSKVLESELRIVEVFASLANEMSSAKDFNPYEIFRILDREKKNWIDLNK